jgi:hypothetical protein
MPYLRLLPRLATLCSAVLLAACGGSGGGPGAPGGAPTTTPTTLSLSVSSLALKTSGIARTVTVTNTGSAPAISVIYSLITVTDTTAISSCSTLAPGASCQITITPGATASAAAGALAPTPINLNVGGLNTNVASAAVHVLDFGSVYQSGYVFDFDDTTPATGSVGGKVVALSDELPGVPWGASVGGAPAFNDIAGVNENSTGPAPSCAGNTDGTCNTAAIVNGHAPTDPVFYAAGACDASIKDTRVDWYLPAICELGSSVGAGCAAGGNIQQNLIDNGKLPVADQPSMTYWSSTQYSASPITLAWSHFFVFPGGTQGQSNKASSFPVRCVHAITL